MRKTLAMISLFVCMFASAYASSTAQNLIPQPKQIKYLSKKTVKLKSVDIKIIPTEGAPSEQYTLTTKRGKATIIAQSKQAEIWGAATLRQLTDKEGRVPEVEIIDYPSFPIRGFMHDTGRNFRDIELLKRDIDLMSAYKLNVFHWHLTDNPAWRIESHAYPELNDAKYHPKGRDEGKFYTYDQIRELIAYAKERGVMIIPEIDMPGHSKAVIETYPQVGCTNKDKTMSVNGEVNNVWCVGNEKTYTMIDNIVAELAALFPSEKLHLGGDEVNMDNWKNCPHCQAFMKKMGMKEEIELQNYFVRRMEKIAAKYGKVLVGWDEIRKGGDLEPSTIVYGWASMKTGAEAVRKGQRTVFLPAQYCYMDMKQSKYERGHDWAAIVTLDSTYKLDPIKMNVFTPEQEELV